MGRPPQSIDEFFSIIDHCATIYGGDNWEANALLGLQTLVVLALVIGAIVLLVRALR